LEADRHDPVPQHGTRTPRPDAHAPEHAGEQVPRAADALARAAMRRALTPGDVLRLQRAIGNRAVGRLLGASGAAAARVQRVPAKNATDKWVDAAADGKEYVTLAALATANADTYAALGAADLIAVLKVLRDNMGPDELRTVFNAALQTKVTELKTKVNVRVIRFPGVEKADVDARLAEAGEILSAVGMEITVAEHLEETANAVKAGIKGLSKTGEFAQGTTGADQWDLAGRYVAGNVLPLVWIGDFTGYGWFGKPNAMALQLRKNAQERTLVLMRPDQTGQTLAHEIGHALGGTLDDLKHGRHVDAKTQRNLMHSDPLFASLHTHLRREQIAAFKASRFVTTA
jgi:predicted nuclease of predicted toxin-antitoxin system